jgi:adenosylcobinamide-GDP ribazoletransferase
MLLKWVVLLRLVRGAGFGTIVSGVVLARMAQVMLAERLPYARQEGGTATEFVNGAGLPHLLAAVFSGAAMTAAMMHAEPLSSSALLFLTAVLSAASVGVLSLKKIGGVTGDVLGAVSEITEVLVWLCGALLLS